MLWRRGKYLASAGIRTPNRPTRSLVTASITLLRLPIMNIRNIKLRYQNKKGDWGGGDNNNRPINLPKYCNRTVFLTASTMCLCIRTYT
jgi:hypothetical protein